MGGRAAGGDDLLHFRVGAGAGFEVRALFRQLSLMPSEAEWDERFRRGDHASAAPDPFLEESRAYWPLLREGPRGGSSSQFSARGLRALDVACGAGRHAVYLAEAGFETTAVDFSSAALERADGLAKSRGATVETCQMDLEAEATDLGEGIYDLIAVFFYLHGPLFPRLARAIRPGGLLVYKTYSVDQSLFPGRPRHRTHMLEHNELLRKFADFRVLRYEEQWEGRGTAALIARKP